MMGRDVWITGVGAVSGFGVGANLFWRGLLDGQSAVRTITRFDTSDLDFHVGAEAPGNWGAFRETEFALSAAGEAARDARLPETDCDGECWVGILQPDAGPLSEGRPTPGSLAAETIADQLKFRGFRSSVATACSSAGTAAAMAAERIAAGISDVALAGGTVSLFRAAHSGLATLRALASADCRPFDAARDGVALGEGAAFVVLESADRARRRGATPYARLTGAGMSCDATHPLAMDRSGRGVRQALGEAVAAAGHGVSLVLAHGTGTILNDSVEAAAVAEIYGPECRVVSLKGSIGHTMSASAGFNLVAACLALRDQMVPGNSTLKTPDPLLPALRFPMSAEPWDGDGVAVHAFGFGGQNVCLILSRAE